MSTGSREMPKLNAESIKADGRVTVKCQNCNGNGVISRNDRIHKCPACGGNKVVQVALQEGDHDK